MAGIMMRNRWTKICLWAALAGLIGLATFAFGADDTARFYGTWKTTFPYNGRIVTMISVHDATGYKNYIVRFDWKFKRPAKLEDDEKFGGNSGLLVHITGKQKVGPGEDIEILWVGEAVSVAKTAAERSGWDQVPWEQLVKDVLAIH